MITETFPFVSDVQCLLHLSGHLHIQSVLARASTSIIRFKFDFSLRKKTVDTPLSLYQSNLLTTSFNRLQNSFNLNECLLTSPFNRLQNSLNLGCLYITMCNLFILGCLVKQHFTEGKTHSILDAYWHYHLIDCTTCSFLYS